MRWFRHRRRTWGTRRCSRRSSPAGASTSSCRSARRTRRPWRSTSSVTTSRSSRSVPSHLQALLAAERPERLIPELCLVLGGETCPWSLVDRVRALRPGCQVLNHYGPTETTVGVRGFRADRGFAGRVGERADRQTSRQYPSPPARSPPASGAMGGARRALHRRCRAGARLSRPARGDGGELRAGSVRRRARRTALSDRRSRALDAHRRADLCWPYRPASEDPGLPGSTSARSNRSSGCIRRWGRSR